MPLESLLHCYSLGVYQSDAEANESEAVTVTTDVASSSNGDNSAVTAERWLTCSFHCGERYVTWCLKGHMSNFVVIIEFVWQLYIWFIADHYVTAELRNSAYLVSVGRLEIISSLNMCRDQSLFWKIPFLVKKVEILR